MGYIYAFNCCMFGYDFNRHCWGSNLKTWKYSMVINRTYDILKLS